METTPKIKLTAGSRRSPEPCSTFFIIDWDWLLGQGKGENRYDCSACKSEKRKHEVVFEAVGHTEYGETVTRRRCTGCGFEEKSRWVKAPW